jgi:Catalytic LigB subunit of aromatic ring-opening dioxygenase
MGEILGLGLSHYPNLRGTDDAMASILRRALERPDIPAEWKDSKNWPPAMQAEWGNDEGRSAAPKHREEFVKHLRVLRKELDEFKPDFIVMWGDDQYENFKEDVIPPFCLYAYDDMEIYPYRPRRDRLAPAAPTSQAPAPPPANAWGESPDTKILVRGKREAAKYLARGLLNEKIDVSYAYQPLHYEGLSHAFLNGVMYLDYDRKGFDYPVIPMVVNCYGSRVLVNRGGSYPVGKISVAEGDLDPPSPSPERCMEAGAAVARVLQRSPWRVALVASSSWSHAFLVPKHYFIYPDVDNDRKLYDALAKGDYDHWRNVSESEVVDRGQQEVLNWWCLLGAMEELGHKAPDYHGYVESYVMNSNKCFAVYKP